MYVRSCLHCTSQSVHVSGHKTQPTLQKSTVVITWPSTEAIRILLKVKSLKHHLAWKAYESNYKLCKAT